MTTDSGNFFLAHGTMKSDVFRSALHRQLAQADERGVLHLDVNSDRLHKQIGDYQ